MRACPRTFPLGPASPCPHLHPPPPLPSHHPHLLSHFHSPHLFPLALLCTLASSWASPLLTPSRLPPCPHSGSLSSLSSSSSSSRSLLCSPLPLDQLLALSFHFSLSTLLSFLFLSCFPASFFLLHLLSATFKVTCLLTPVPHRPSSPALPVPPPHPLLFLPHGLSPSSLSSLLCPDLSLLLSTSLVFHGCLGSRPGSPLPGSRSGPPWG